MIIRNLQMKTKLILDSSLVETEIQVIQFINEVYQPEEPLNTDNIYDMKTASTADIYNTFRMHTAIFENKSVLSLSRWCSNARLSFSRAQEEQKKKKHSSKILSCYGLAIPR